MLDTDLISAQTKSTRLMVVLHGLGDSMEGYRWMPDELSLPWLNYLLVNAPDEYYGGYSWYDIFGKADPGVRRSRQLLFELLDSLPTMGFRPSETVVFGFSQGCLMTIEVGARYPYLLAGLVGISGYVHDPDNLLRELSPVARQQRFLITHGLHDPLIPIAQTRQQIRWLQAAGLNIEWHELRKEHSIEGAHEISLIRNFVEKCFSAESGRDIQTQNASR
ncbi:MAG TPA: serine esterase [Verrucomicrobiota bacterium]|nr:serine esterase [Verrucomicrobiota bacterium]HOK76443.1 serine esterase [Verrucomicrobiota bacterium]